MAVVNHADQGETGFLPMNTTVWGGVVSATEVMTADGSATLIKGAKFGQRYFAAVSDGDTWDGASDFPPPPALLAVAWQGDDTDTDKAAVTITAIGENPSVRFDVENAASSGSVWFFYKEGGRSGVLSRGVMRPALSKLSLGMIEAITSLPVL